MKKILLPVIALFLLLPLATGQSIVVNPSDNATSPMLANRANPLETNVDSIKLWLGGDIDFSLDAGVVNAGRIYCMLCSASGTLPGIPLPGGIVTLPLNWDPMTTALLQLNIPGMIGFLDNYGEAKFRLTIPPTPFPTNFSLAFAYALKGKPWDFASNAKVITFLATAPPEYKYDDGSSEDSFGFPTDGYICWMHAFDATGGSDVIKSVGAAWGTPSNPGTGPMNGYNCMFLIWDDPNNDGDPSDAVCLDGTQVQVANVDTDILTYADFYNPVPVKGGFFVGCVMQYKTGMKCAPVDTTGPSYTGEAWVGWDPTFFDYKGLSNNAIPPAEISSIGGPKGYFLLRAEPN